MLQSTVSTAISAVPSGRDVSRTADGGFFRHHGPWAPAVRLFRALQFRSKAALISLTFLVPMLLLAASLWRSTQETIDFADKERAGVAAMRSLVPVLDGVLEVRFTTRAIFGGFDAAADRHQAWERTAKAILALQQSTAAAGDPIGLGSTVASLQSAWQATGQSLDVKDGSGLSVFAPVTATMVTMLTRLGEDSNLVLDPHIDSAYLVNGLVLVLPSAAEDVARVWGWTTYARAKGGLDARGSKDYQVWSTNAASRLAQGRAYFERAIVANPSLQSKLDLKAIDVALAFRKDAVAAVEAGTGDAQSLYGEGRAATVGLFRVYDTGLAALDELLAARIAAAQDARHIQFATVVLCLVASAYLFYAFFLVTQGGLKEVERHLTAMTEGDLTTSPNPWGKDEAAALMLAMRQMQQSLRGIVAGVRTSSESIVHASSEISSASMDLSARTERSAANLQQNAASMEEISSTVKRNAESVRQAAQLAQGNSQSAARGGAAVAQVVSTMEGINASSKKIGDIIGTIDGIAFQTNILALNAAVEAARAGEHGRGFAVVASEVRILAQRSAQAAREIKTLITTSVEKVEAGAQVVQGAGETMRELVGNAGRMNELLSGISIDAGQQSIRIEQVGSAIGDLDRMTQANAALVEQTAAAAMALKDQAQDLTTQARKFKLPIGR